MTFEATALADVQKSVGRVISPGGFCEETRRFRKTPSERRASAREAKHHHPPQNRIGES